MIKNSLMLLFALITGFFGAWLFSTQKMSDTAQKQDIVFERVMSSGVIRCGYVSAPPFLIKDPNSGQLSGIAHDVMEAVGQALSLRVEWVEEVGWATFPVALKSGRFDSFCAGVWPSSARAREIDHTLPISFQPYYAYVRINDMRFDNGLQSMNEPSVRLSVMDGDTSQIIARNDFPKGNMISLVETTGPDDMLHNVASNKADVAFMEPTFFVNYAKTNPGKLRQIQSAPLRVFGNVFFIAQGEDKLRRMLNAAITEQLSSGVVGGIIKKYEEMPGLILRVAPPYSSP